MRSSGKRCEHILVCLERISPQPLAIKSMHVHTRALPAVSGLLIIFNSDFINYYSSSPVWARA